MDRVVFRELCPDRLQLGFLLDACECDTAAVGRSFSLKVLRKVCLSMDIYTV